MTKGDGSVEIYLNLDDKDFDKRLSAVEGKTSSFGKKIGAVLGSLGIAKIAKDFLSAGVNYNIAMENYTAGLTTLLGSAEKAEKMIADLKDYAAKTPFEMSDLANATQTLLAFGVEQKNVMGIMKQLGDVSLGDQQKFQSLALVFGQVSSQGKLMGQDLLQMINAGFNPLQIISEKTGKSMASLKEEMSKGKIGIKEVEQAFKWATEEGGKFYGGMDRGSKTMSGQISTLKDNFNSFAGEAMKPLTDYAKDKLVPALIDIFNNTDKIAEKLIELKPLVLGVGTAFLGWQVGKIIHETVVGFQTAKMTLALFSLEMKGASVAQGLFNGSLTLGETLVALFTGKTTFASLATAGWTKATVALNAAWASNPIGIVVAAIALLAGGFIYLWNTSEEFRNFWIKLWEDVSAFFIDAWKSITEFFTKTIPEAWDSFLLKLGEVRDSIIQFFIDAWNGVISFFTETIPAWIQSVIDWFNKLPYMIGYAIGTVIATFINWGMKLYEFATVDIPKFIESIGKWFSELPGRIGEWISKAWEDIKTWGSNVYNSAKEWISKTIDSVVSYFKELPGKIWTWLVNAYNNVTKWASNLWDAGKKAASDLIDSVVGGLKSLPKKLGEIGSNMIKGFWDGIKGVKNWIMDKIGGFFNGIVDGIKDFFGIHSPSALMRDMIGKFLPPGIAVGFELAMPKTTKDMTDSLDKMTNDLQSKIDMNMNDINASATLESNAKLSINKEIVNSFPKSMKMEGQQNVYLVTEDGTELAHFLAPFMDKEFKFE